MFLLYQLLSEHVTYFKRWASPKAYFIINALEIVFWSAVVFLVMQANLKSCVGTSCALGWVVVVLSVFMRYTNRKPEKLELKQFSNRSEYSNLSIYTAVVTYLDYRYFKAEGKHRGPTEHGHPLTSTQM